MIRNDFYQARGSRQMLFTALAAGNWRMDAEKREVSTFYTHLPSHRDKINRTWIYCRMPREDHGNPV
jgi:hypothetical protein